MSSTERRKWADLAPDIERLTPYDVLHMLEYAELIDLYDHAPGWNSELVHRDMDNLEALPRSPYRTILSHLKRALWLVGPGCATCLETYPACHAEMEKVRLGKA